MGEVFVETVNQQQIYDNSTINLKVELETKSKNNYYYVSTFQRLPTK